MARKEVIDLLKEIAASIGAMAASGNIPSDDIVEMLAESLENLAECMDLLSEILEAYASEGEIK